MELICHWADDTPRWLHAIRPVKDHINETVRGVVGDLNPLSRSQPVCDWLLITLRGF